VLPFNIIVNMGIHADIPESLHTAPEKDADENCRVRDEPPPETDEHGYRIKEQPMGTKNRVKVILMGAGASSLNFFKKAEEDMENLDMVCYEKNNDIGGTWLENKYPGCACDIPSVNYQFSWKIKLWSHYYSYAPEIWEYLKSIERENDFIAKYIKLRHRVERAKWDDAAGLWRCQIRDLEKDVVFEDSANFFINAGGVLNNWKWPDIPGLMGFKGKLMHSANYDQGYDLSGKRVAVIGAGSSGVQIVAAIQHEVKHLYHWVRSPVWITAGFAQSWAGKNGANFQCKPSPLKSRHQLMFARQRGTAQVSFREPKQIPRVS
jgi:cation diffusion facilitator CzcD-associated flavoprotein CzcO